MDPQPEAVRPDVGSDEVEPQAHAGRAPYLVGPVEPAQHGLALLLGDPCARVGHAHDAAPAIAQQLEVDAAAFRREFDGVVDEIGDSLHQQVAIAAYRRLTRNPDAKGDALALGDRLVEVEHLPKQLTERDAAESGTAPAVLDLRKAQ